MNGRIDGPLKTYVVTLSPGADRGGVGRAVPVVW